LCNLNVFYIVVSL